MRKKSVERVNFVTNLHQSNPDTYTNSYIHGLLFFISFSNISSNQWKLDFEMFYEKNTRTNCVCASAQMMKYHRSKKKMCLLNLVLYIGGRCLCALCDGCTIICSGRTLISLLQCWRKNVLNSQIWKKRYAKAEKERRKCQRLISSRKWLGNIYIIHTQQFAIFREHFPEFRNFISTERARARDENLWISFERIFIF